MRHYKSYSFGLVHLESATTRWKKENCQRSLWRRKTREERKGTETLQFKSREKIVMFAYVQDCEVKDAF